jgi:hypothetical protein
MNHVIVLLAGLVIGVLLSGVGAALVVPLMPESWRGGPTLAALAVAITVGTMIVVGRLFAKSSQ